MLRDFIGNWVECNKWRFYILEANVERAKHGKPAPVYSFHYRRFALRARADRKHCIRLTFPVQ